MKLVDKKNSLFPTSEFVFQVFEIIRNNRELKGKVTPTLADCNIFRKRRARDKL